MTTSLLLREVWEAIPRVGVIVIIMSLYLTVYPDHVMFMFWVGIFLIAVYVSAMFFQWIFWDREETE